MGSLLDFTPFPYHNIFSNFFLSLFYEAETVEEASATSSITLDNVSSGTGSGASFSLSHTTANLSNGILVVGVSRTGTANTVDSVTYNGIHLSSAIRAANTSVAFAELWYLVDPPQGIHNVTVYVDNASTSYIVGALTYDGVDQTTPIFNTASDQGTATSSLLNLNTKAGQMVVDVFSKYFTTGTPDIGQTTAWSEYQGGGTYKPSISNSTLMSWTGGATATQFAHVALALAPALNCTYTISGTEGGSYFVNAGEGICLETGAQFTGQITLNGGTLTNNAIAPQAFTITTINGSTGNAIVNNGIMAFPSSMSFFNTITITNNGTFSTTTNFSLASSVTYINNDSTHVGGRFLNQGDLTNVGKIVVADVLRGYASSDMDNQGSIEALDLVVENTWSNSGLFTVTDTCELMSGSSGTINAGCMSCGSIINAGTINGTACGDLNVDNNSTQLASGIMSGTFAFIDRTPPPSAPFIDNNLGFVSPSIVWASCNACFAAEICDNGLDDDGDGLVDAFDADCPCACPPGGTVITAIPNGYTIPAGETHCLNADVTLNAGSNNFTVNGDLYILSGNTLEILSGGINVGADGDILVCKDAGYHFYNGTFNVDYDLYNFGWVQLCGTGPDFNNTFFLGENSLTAIYGTGVDWFGSIEYNGAAGGNAYMYIKATAVNPSVGGNVCLNGEPEIIVELDNPWDSPTCVTDCNGCAALSTVSETCNDGSVKTTYTALNNAIEICGNLEDDNGDGRIDEPYPGGVESNLQLWLKADQGPNTLVNGNNVTSWTDQSPNAYSANADANATDFPTYSTSSINYNPGVTFDGTFTDYYSDGLHLGADYIFSDNGGMHIFSVSYPEDGGNSFGNIFQFGNRSTEVVGLSWAEFLAMYQTPTAHNGVDESYNHSDTNQPVLLGFEIDFNTSQTLSRNGSTMESVLIPNLDQITANEIAESDHFGDPAIGDHQMGPVTIGRQSASEFLNQNRIFKGPISEVLVFNDTLSESDKEKVHAYLAIKYGISLNHNYVSSSGTTLKSPSDGYDHQIFGIGRDDCSGLHQKQSKSVEDEATLTLSLGAIAATNQANVNTLTQDESFLILANDGGTVDTWSALGDLSTDNRIARTWKINNTNINQNVTFTIDVDVPSLNIASLPPGAVGGYQIMFDQDGDFTNGGSLKTSLVNTGGSLYEVTLNPGSWEYFTIIHTGAAEICGNTVDDDGDGRVDCADSDCNTTYYASAQSSTGPVTNPANVLGAPDGLNAVFGANAQMIIDLGSALDIGEEYTLSISHIMGGVLSIEESIDGINFFSATGSPFNSLTDISIATSVHTRYLRITTDAATPSTSLDAITYGNCICQMADLVEEYRIAGVGPFTQGDTVRADIGNSVILNFTGTDYDTWTFIWTGPNSFYQVTDSGTDRDQLFLSNLQASAFGEYQVVYFDTIGCVDSSTFIILSLTEICGNGVDNDGDGLLDCNDPDCQGSYSLNLPDSVECVDATSLLLDAGGLPAGTFSGPGVTGTNFDASAAGLGVHNINYAFNNSEGCLVNLVDSIAVFAVPMVSFDLVDSVECDNGTISTLAGGSPGGGVYTGNGVSGGNFNATAAGLGTHAITYTYTNGDGCSASAVDSIEVISPPAVTLTLVNDSDCITSTALNLDGGSPTGGSYSGLHVSGNNFDPSSAGAGIHTITYTYTDVNGCTNSNTDQVVVFGLPSVSLTLTDDEDCVLNNTLVLSGGLPAGGTYSGPGVSGTNFDAASAGLGTHTISYTFTDVNGCTNTATDQMEVVADPTVTFSLATTDFCIDHAAINLTNGAPAGGTYSGAGVSGTSFNPAIAGAGTHTITYSFTDGNACSNSATEDINVYAIPVINAPLKSNPSTCGGNNGSITVNASSGTGNFEYRIDGGAWQSNNVFSGLSSGSYLIEVQNDNGFCLASSTESLSDPASPVSNIDASISTTCIGSNVDFSADDAGVGATYSWDFGLGASPATTTGIGAHAVTYSSNGNKLVQLTVQKDGCTTIDSQTIVVNALPVVSLSLVTDAVCESSSILTLSGGNPSGGSFSGSGVSGTNFDAASVGPGNYTITYTFTDANGCTNTASDQMIVTALPTVSLDLGTSEVCISNNSVSLTGASPSGGTFSGTGVSAASFNATTAGAGTHLIQYTYTDANGCTNTATDNIVVFDFPTINLVTPSNPTTCSGTQGSIVLSASGATGNFQYRLNSGTWQNSNTFSGLSAGSYNVFIRNSNGFCEMPYASNPVVLADPPATIVTTTVISDYTGEDITCVGASDGFAIASGSGGTRPYTFAWSNLQTGDTLKNVVAGTYTVTATDALGCQGTQTVTLNDPPPLGITAVFTNPTCFGASDGTIDVTATGGVGAYTYAWNDLGPIAFYPFDGTTEDIAGNDHHAVAVWGTEAYSNDAIDVQSFEFKNSTGIKLDDGVFLDVPFTQRSVIMNIKPEEHDQKYILYEEGGFDFGIALGINKSRLTGVVSNGIFKRSAFSIDIPQDNNWHEVGFVYDRGDFTLLLNGVAGTTRSTGFDTVYVNALGSFNDSGLGDAFGNTAYRFESYDAFEGLMDNVAIYDVAYTGFATQAGGGDSSGGDRTGIPAGDYLVYVYDLNGCIDSISLTLTQPDSLALTATISNVSCNGLDNGVIDLEVAGGVAPFEYTWSNSELTQDLDSLGPGTYSVTVLDDNDCEVVGTYRVDEPPLLSLSASVSSNYNGFNVTCFGDTDGSATTTASGGTPPYSYNWTTGATTNNLTNIGVGKYIVTLTDAGACTAIDSVTLNGPAQLSATTAISSSFAGEHISCVGASDGQAQVTVLNGVAPYTYTWSNGQTGNDLINVTEGTYGVTVQDANGCTTTSSVTLNDPSPLVLDVDINSNFNGENISCADAEDGELEANVSGGAGNVYSYEWSDGSIDSVLTGIPAGTYSVTVSNNFGCTATQSVSLGEPDPLDSDITINSDYNGFVISCNGGTDGAIEASATGGVGPYSYAWSNDAVTTPENNNIGAGTYFVTVTDANACTSVSSVSISNPTNISFSVTGNPPTDCGANDGSIVMFAGGGIGTFEFSLDGITYQNSGSFTGLGPGSYFGYVRNQLGTCVTGPVAIVVNPPEAPTIDNLTIINPTTSSSNDGAILVAASGGGIAIEYSIDGTTWQLSNLFENLDEGALTVYIRYVGFTCISSQTINLIVGAGVIGNVESNFCSGDLSGVSFVEVYYIPFQEDHILSALQGVYPDACSGADVNDPVQTYVSVGIVEDKTIITFDHWEDGFENDLSYPAQTTTEIWGDGNPLNGMPPGFVIDELNASDIIILSNPVNSTTRGALPPDYDGGDKLGSRGNLAITRLGWAAGPNNFLAGAIEVFPTELWGKNYKIPIGSNTNVNEMFEYTAATIMARADSTTVQIDTDGDGFDDLTLNLDEGESELVTGLFSGAEIDADDEVQVHLVTGDICHTYETRWFTLKPTSSWSDSYFNPVATPNNGTDTHTDFVNAPTYVHLYNPNGSPITINWEDKDGYQDDRTIPAGQTDYFEVNANTGSHFYSTDGSSFYAMATIDSDQFANNARNDWGFALTPESSLSSQITLVGFAPGSVPTIPNNENSSPIWITADHYSGNPSTANITICIDFNGDGYGGGGVPLTDLNGTEYDTSIVLQPLAHDKIYDPDGDQTGMRLWVCDGSNAVIAGAWGQAPADVTQESYALDLGVGLPNGIPFAASKCVELSRDHNSNGLYDECDEVTYTLLIRNTGVLPLSTGSLKIVDTLVSDITYIPNSTKLIIEDVVTDIADDGSGSIFPFDETGLTYASLVSPGDSVMFKFDAVIGTIGSPKFIQNFAHVTNGQSELTSEVSFPAQVPTGPLLAGVPNDTTANCSYIPDAPVIGADIYTINNCEEMDTIPQGLWSVNAVNSEQAGNAASLAFDDDPNTFWMTDNSGSGPAPPHEIQIDLGAKYFVTGFRYLPRQDDSDGRIRDYEFYVSDNDSIWGPAAASGIFADNGFPEEVVFHTSYGRYVRIVALNEVNFNPWAAIAELDVFHCINYAAENMVFNESSTKTSDGSATDICYEITRSWTVTDYCNRTNTFSQVITVEDNEGPEMFNLPADITVTDTIPSAPSINCTDPDCIFATDNCDTTVVVVFSEVNVPNGCLYDVNRTWRAVDKCGNETSHTQTISVASVMALSTMVTSDFNGRDISCTTATDGTAEIAVTGGTPPYTIAWEGGQSGTEATGLAADTYSITVTDDAGCITVDSVSLLAPPPILISANVSSDFNGEDISCFGENDGSAIVTASGGTGTLDFLWSNDSTSTNISNLVAGTYTVTVTDDNGCVNTASVTLENPAELQLTLDVTSDYNGQDISCPGLSDGEATVTATGGTGSLIYAWSNSVSTPVNSGLSAEKYYVTVTDENGCFEIDSIIINDPTPIDLMVDAENSPGLCGGNDGSIILSATGGAGSYQYRLGPTGTWQNSASFTGLTAGTYEVFVRNSDGTCESTATEVVLDDPIPQACPITFAADTTRFCNENINVVLSIPTAPGATGYTWEIPAAFTVVSGLGTPSLVLDMNNALDGFYDICVVTNSDCGDSPECCTSIELITCAEICSDGIDNDGDGNIDSADDECLSCDSLYTSNLEYIQQVSSAGIAADTLNSSVLINQADALGIDPASQRFYFLEQGSNTPSISYIDPITGNQINTAVSIPATAPVPALGFNLAGLGYALSENGELYSITTNAGGSNTPVVNLIGNVGAVSLGDLAVDNAGNIWAVINSNQLIVIDPTLATPTISNLGSISETGNFGANPIEAIAFEANGTLKVGAGSNLYDVNVTTVQATFVSNLGQPAHDFASCAFPVFSNDLSVSKVVSPNGTVNPGDTLTYTITIANDGTSVITGANFTDTIPGGTSYLANSTTLNGISVSDAAGIMAYVSGAEIHSNGSNAGILVPGQDAVVSFRVIIDCCSGRSAIINQGVADFNGSASAVLSDDPSLPGATDSTAVDLNALSAPNIITAASNETIDCNTATNSTLIDNWLNSHGGAVAAVDCDTVTWSHNYTGLTPTCGGGGSASVIFTATNACGLTNTTTAVFTIIDTIPPVWTVSPSDIDVECNGTADPRGEISSWLSNDGGATVADACGTVNVTHNYTMVPNNGCGNTGSVTITFTATDECGRSSSRTAELSIIDTSAPVLDPIDDITVDCDEIPASPTPSAQDSCDTDVAIAYSEVAIYHPDANWRASLGCDILYSISSVTYDDKGTVGDTSDDEMSFTMAVIGQDVGGNWSTNINGTPISDNYNTVLNFGPYLSNGPVLNFTIADGADGACTKAVTINAADY